MPWTSQYRSENYTVGQESPTSQRISGLQCQPKMWNQKYRAVKKYFNSWWLSQPIWKIWVKLGSSSPSRGENSKNIWNHHVVYMLPSMKSWLIKYGSLKKTALSRFRPALQNLGQCRGAAKKWLDCNPYIRGGLGGIWVWVPQHGMVHNRKTLLKWDDLGVTPSFGNIHMV